MLTSIDANLALPYWNRPAVDRLLRAGVVFGSQPAQIPPSSEAAKRGLRYERKVLASAARRWGLRFAPQPSFFFQTCNKRGRAILDGLVLLGDLRALVIEVKTQFSADAWYQVHKFYLPIVREALPGQDVRGLVVCRNFDPWVKLPKEPRLVDSPEQVFADPSTDSLCVLISRDGRL